MKPVFPRLELEEVFPSSSIDALVHECLHMGWPLDPFEGRAEVERFLRFQGISPQDPSRPIDLYAALNAVRQVCWTEGGELWTRYVTSRRTNVEKMSMPQAVALRLCRTYYRNATPGRGRARLPVPIEHPTQSNETWKILSSTVPIVEQREHPGALDLTLEGDTPSFSVEIEYRADVMPQRQSSHGEAPRVPRTGIRSPFVLHQLISDELPSLMRESSLAARIQELYKLFLERLVSGHVHHSTRTSTGSTERLSFDCVTGSWLFAECAERLGIPARVLSGVILNDFGPSPHFWCEVHLNGEWLPIDLYGWDLSRDDTSWAARFFLSLECRLRFELYPHAFSRFLPNIPWFIERHSSSGISYVTYRCQRTGLVLAEDAWTMKTP